MKPEEAIYRREIKVLIESIQSKYNFTFEQIASLLLTTMGTVSRWYRMKTSAEKIHNQALIILEKTGRFNLPDLLNLQTQSGEINFKALELNHDVLKEVSRDYIGRMRQLTEQVNLLEGQIKLLSQKNSEVNDNLKFVMGEFAKKKTSQTGRVTAQSAEDQGISGGRKPTGSAHGAKA